MSFFDSEDLPYMAKESANWVHSGKTDCDGTEILAILAVGIFRIDS